MAVGLDLGIGKWFLYISGRKLGRRKYWLKIVGKRGECSIIYAMWGIEWKSISIRQSHNLVHDVKLVRRSTFVMNSTARQIECDRRSCNYLKSRGTGTMKAGLQFTGFAELWALFVNYSVYICEEVTVTIP